MTLATDFIEKRSEVVWHELLDLICAKTVNVDDEEIFTLSDGSKLLVNDDLKTLTVITTLNIRYNLSNFEINLTVENNIFVAVTEVSSDLKEIIYQVIECGETSGKNWNLIQC